MSEKNMKMNIMKVLVVICNTIVLGLLAIDIFRSGVPSDDYFLWTLVVLLSSAAFCTLAVVLMPQIKWCFRLMKKTARGVGLVLKRNSKRLAVIVGAAILCLFAVMLIAGRDIPPPDDSDLALERPDVSDEENALYWFARAAEAKLWPEGGRDAYNDYRYPKLADELPDMELVGKTFEMNEVVFAKIERGLQQEVCLTPRRTLQDLFSGDSMPYLAEWRSMARFMAARVRYERESGHYADAAELAAMLLNYGDMITRDSDSIIHYLVGIAVISIGLSETMDLARDEGISQEQLVTLSGALDGMKPLGRGLIRGLKGEYRIVADLLEHIGKEGYVYEYRYVSGPVEFLLTLNKVTGYFLQPNRTKKTHANNTRKVIENARRCYADLEMEDFADYCHDLVGMPDVIRHLPRPNPVGKALIPAITIAHDRLLEQKLRLEFSLSATRLIIALHAYKKAEGKAPQRLTELLPDYIDAVPRDPFDGELFKYNPSLDVVYSVGKDLQDHGGRPVLFADDPWRGEYFVYEAGINVESFQEEVKKVVLSEEDPELRAGAIKKLDDQVLLEKLAMESKHRQVRAAAAGGLTDQTVLENIATEDETATVRSEAVRNIISQELLEHIAVKDESSQVRRDAVRKLRNQELLERIVHDDPSFSVRRSAVRRLTNQDLVGKLALESPDLSVRKAAVENLTDQALLEKIALEEPEKCVRWAAVRNLTDQEVIAKVALGDTEWAVRQRAVFRLNDRDVLKQIAEEDEKLAVRQAAGLRLWEVGP